WFLIRLIQGMSISTLFVLSESWIVGAAGDNNRGKVVAFYAAILSGSFGAGPLLISFIGIDGWLPFITGTVVITVGVLALLLIPADERSDPEETPPSGVLSFAPKAPMLVAAVGIMAVFDAATLSLIPVYGVKVGLDLPTSATMLTALILGNTVLQFPIGWMADRYSHRRLITGLAIITALCLLLLPLFVGTWPMWPLLIVLGTTGYGVYTVALTSLGNRFSGSELVSGSACFSVMFGFGALIGSVSGGWAMLGFGPHGLPLFLAATYFCLILALTYRQLTHRENSV
ncbi:MAG: MFS transporter, partial [Pseudomonadota bacterium]